MKQTRGYWNDPVSGSRTDFTINSVGEFHEAINSAMQATFYRTDSAAQAFMNTTAVVNLNRTTVWQGEARYDGYGAYAVEMTPREQWVYSAPFYIPLHPSNTTSFINVVTDTASAAKLYWGATGQGPMSRVPLTQAIPGTDLVWGSMQPPTGADLWIGGWDPQSRRVDTSVRFYGFVYGFHEGHEEFWPNGTEYREYLAVTYGYPLAPSRMIVGSGDELQIDVLRDCYRMTVNVIAMNENPAGLRSIALDSNNNAKIRPTLPRSSERRG
jgi:hypothetical protein